MDVIAVVAQEIPTATNGIQINLFWTIAMTVLQLAAHFKEPVFMLLRSLKLGFATRNGSALEMDAIAIVEPGILTVPTRCNPL
jgi:hypothetical protein